MSEPTERWLPVVRWEGLYEVSNLGTVRSLPRLTAAGIRRGGPLRPSPDNAFGYLKVTLKAKGRRSETRRVHKLVAEAFIGQCPPGEETRHGPGGKTENGADHLSYGTPDDNNEDRAIHGSYHYKLTRADAAAIRRRLAAGELQRVIAADYGVNSNTISRIKTGTRWRVPAAT